MKDRFNLFVILFIISLILISGCVTETEKNGNDVEFADQNGDETPCEGEYITFDFPPFDLEKVSFILPMGGMTGAHVTPIDHQYYVSYDFDEGDEATVDIEVYSPADGIVTQIEHMGVAAGDNPIAVDDYRLWIQHTCTISSVYIHVDELSDNLSIVAPELGGYASVNVEVKAGEVIGRYGGSVDYNIVDEDVELYFVNPDSYVAEDWKIHCPNPFDYFNEPIKSQLIEKCVRDDEPIGGKIAYDIDGKLIGTWFEEGTNGYGGVNLNRYWAGHLSIVYDSIDSDGIIVSIGTFVDTAEQFAVNGNAPDPANISVDNGLIVYDLVDFEYYKDGTVWNRSYLSKGLELRGTEHVRGVILLQLLEDRKLKVEIFPNQTSNEVSNFTKDAKIFVR